MKKTTKIILWTVAAVVVLAAIGYGVLVWLAIAATGGWGYGIPSGRSGKVDNRVIRTNAPPAGDLPGGQKSFSDAGKLYQL